MQYAGAIEKGSRESDLEASESTYRRSKQHHPIRVSVRTHNRHAPEALSVEVCLTWENCRMMAAALASRAASNAAT